MGHLNSICIGMLADMHEIKNDKRVSVAEGASQNLKFIFFSINVLQCRIDENKKNTYLAVHQQHRPDNVVLSTGTVHSLPV